MQANSETLSFSCKELQHTHTAIWPWSSSKDQKSWTKFNIEHLRFGCGGYLCQVTTWCMQFLRSCVHKATWPWASLTVQKNHTKINIKLVRYVDMENIPMKLQHHTGNTWGVIAFTWQLDHELDWKFKKVTQRSTSNLSKILMWKTLVRAGMVNGDNWMVARLV